MDKLGLSKPSNSSKPKSKDRSGSGDQAESQKERVDERRKRKSKKTREVEKKDREEQTKLGQLKEEDLHFASGVNDKLTLGDLFNSLNPEEEGQPLNSTKLHKQFRSLEKEAQKAPVLQAPVSGRKRKRQEMDANYAINQKNLGKYVQQVKKAREETQSDFTTRDKLVHGGGIVLNNLAQVAANRENASSNAAISKMEQEIQAELKRQGL